MNTLLLKVKSFPEVSETWMISIIKIARKKNVEVVLVTDVLKNLESHNVSKNLKIVQDAARPINKKWRKAKALIILLKNIRLLGYYLKYVKLKGKHSLDYLFTLNTYWELRNIDVHHVHFVNATKPLDELKAIGFLSGKLIVTCHGYDVHFSNESECLRKKMLYELAFKQADLITVNGKYLYEKVIALGAPSAKSKIVHIGADQDVFQPSANRELFSANSKIKLISIGRLIELKGHRYAIEAVSILKSKNYDVSYRIIGEGESREELEDMIKAFNLIDEVELKGAKTRAQVARCLDEAHIFLMPSITDSSNRAEAQGLVLAEAQLMGLPIIAFDSGGIKLAVSGESAILVKEKDVNAIVDAIITLAHNQEQYERMSKKSRTFALQNFSAMQMFEKYYTGLN